MPKCEETTSELLTARLFIYTHACRILDQGWATAEVTLNKIENFQRQPPEARLPIMLTDQWAEIEAQIRAIAKSDRPSE